MKKAAESVKIKLIQLTSVGLNETSDGKFTKLENK